MSPDCAIPCKLLKMIRYCRSSRPIIPYYLSDMARNTDAILQHLNIDKAMIVGHSMGGMLAARFATRYPGVTERLVLFNPIGLTDARFTNRSATPTPPITALWPPRTKPSAPA